jgi:hypothetical protein
MSFQLVVQFRPAAPLDFEQLLRIEAAIESRLEETPWWVDGHDMGSGEMNIFLMTDHPAATFAHIQELLEEQKPDGPMHVAFRDVGREDADYVVLWPPGLASFTII